MLSLIIIPLLTGMGYANCGNDNGNGNGCSGDTGPQGPAGPQGNSGVNGTNGTNGNNGTPGTAGTNGVNGKDGATDHAALLVLDTAVRLYDGKYVQWQLFNVYSLNRHNAHDIGEEIQNSRNFMFGTRIVLKLGSSYEEREIAKLRKELLGRP